MEDDASAQVLDFSGTTLATPHWSRFVMLVRVTDPTAPPRPRERTVRLHADAWRPQLRLVATDRRLPNAEYERLRAVFEARFWSLHREIQELRTLDLVGVAPGARISGFSYNGTNGALHLDLLAPAQARPDLALYPIIRYSRSSGATRVRRRGSLSLSAELLPGGTTSIIWKGIPRPPRSDGLDPLRGRLDGPLQAAHRHLLAILPPGQRFILP
jgi:hypothetical protein